VHVGILYVGFTENDNDKKLMSATGEFKAVPARPAFLQQSQNRVAKSVLSMAKYRLNTRTLSVAGKSTSFLSRIAPWIISRLAILSQNN
jgi:hypothetical protein